MATATKETRRDANLTGNWAAIVKDGVALRFQQYRVFRQTVRELSELNDRELSELGLSRAMVRSIAREAAKAA